LKLNWYFQRGGGVQPKTFLQLEGVWIFPGSTQLFYDVDVKKFCSNSEENSRENNQNQRKIGDCHIITKVLLQKVIYIKICFAVVAHLRL